MGLMNWIICTLDDHTPLVRWWHRRFGHGAPGANVCWACGWVGEPPGHSALLGQTPVGGQSTFYKWWLEGEPPQELTTQQFRQEYICEWPSQAPENPGYEAWESAVEKGAE